MYDDELDDEEAEDWGSPDGNDEEAVETVSCPRCGEQIYEDAERCPSCGEHVTHSTSPWSGRPWWFVVLGLAGIVAVVWALTR